MKSKKKIGVIGAGTWGMALARMLSITGNEVQVWSALPEEIEEYSATRRHRNLPNMVIPDEMQFTLCLEEVCADKDILLFFHLVLNSKCVLPADVKCTFSSAKSWRISLFVHRQ